MCSDCQVIALDLTSFLAMFSQNYTSSIHFTQMQRSWCSRVRIYTDHDFTSPPHGGILVDKSLAMIRKIDYDLHCNETCKGLNVCILWGCKIFPVIMVDNQQSGLALNHWESSWEQSVLPVFQDGIKWSLIPSSSSHARVNSSNQWGATPTKNKTSQNQIHSCHCHVSLLG